MGAFVVVLPDKTEIEAGDVEQAFKRRFELVPGRAWLVADDEFYDSTDPRRLLDLSAKRPALIVGVTDFTGFGEDGLARRLSKWTRE